MLFDSSLRRELARNFTATVVVLLTIVMTIVLIRTLGQASRGTVNPSEVLQIMGLTVLGQLSTVLSLCLFITVVSTVSRWYRDSEMVIWFSAGRGMAQFLRPLIRFAWPVWLTIAALSLVAWPWSNQQVAELKVRFEQRNDIERVAPGQFQESAGGTRVFFIDKDSPDEQVGRNVFIAVREKDSEAVTTAREGRIEWQGNEKMLRLESGQQWLRNQKTGEVRLTEFDQYLWRIDGVAADASMNTGTRELDSWALLRQPTPVNVAELCWRLGQVLSGINLCFVALALATVNPRRGRSQHLMMALVSFIVYFNFLNIGLRWIATGGVHWLSFMLALHGGIALLLGLWLWRRERDVSLWPNLRRWRTRGAA